MSMLANPYQHRKGHGWLTTWTPDLVAGAPDPVLALAEYIQQTIGVPWPTIKDQAILRRRVKEFFVACPQADMYTLCRTVQWCRNNGRRFARVYTVIDAVRDAWADKALPELDRRTDNDLQRQIEHALAVETNPSWRARLLAATDVSICRATLTEWRAVRGTK